MFRKLNKKKLLNHTILKNLLRIVNRLILILILISTPLKLNAQEPPLYPNNTIQLTPEEQTWITDNPLITVGVGNWPPIDFVDVNGQPQGIVKDYINLISRETGLKFQYEKNNWQETLIKLENNDIQLIQAIYKNEKREEIFSFSNSFYNITDYFFINSTLPINTIEDLNQYTLAIAKGYEQIPYLKEHFPEITILETDTLDNAINAVIEGKAHILFESYSVLSYTLDARNIEIIKPFIASKYSRDKSVHLATNKKNSTLITIINKVLATLSVVENRSIHQRWFNIDKNSLFTLFTKKQKQWIDENPVIYYGAKSDWLPYDFLNIANEHVGLSSDYLNIISQYTGLTFKAIFDDWNGLIEKAQNNNIDLLPSLYYNEAYNSFLNYSASYQQLENYFFIRADVNTNTITDLNHKSLVLVKHQNIRQILEEKYKKIQFVEVNTLSEAVDMVLEGRVEGIYYDYYSLSAYLKKNDISDIKPFIAENKRHPIFMAATINNTELISIINTVIEHIDEAQNTIIYEQWTSYQQAKKPKEITLTSAERQWLKNNPIINISSYSSLLPYEGFDEHDNYVGIIADYLAVISQKLNVNFNVINTKDNNEALIQLVTGDVEAISTNNQIIETLTTTEPYEKVPLVMVMKDNNRFIHSIHELTNKKITLIKNANYSNTITHNYKHLNFQYEDDISKALTSVSIGKSDVLIVPISQASYYISKLQLHNLNIVGTTQYSIELTFAVLPSKAILKNILNKALANITQEEKQHILTKWGNKKLVKPVDYKLLLFIFTLLLLITIAVVYWNNRLRCEVERRKVTEKQTKMLLEHIPQHVIVWDLLGYIITANKKVLVDYQLNYDDLKKLNVIDFYDNLSDRTKIRNELKEHGRVKDMIVPFKQPDNTVHQMMLSIIPTTYQNKDVYLSIAIDLTERLIIEAELEKAKKKAEIANQAKSEFLANMSHEIRTPMNAIIGFTELLQEQVSEPKNLAFIKTINSAGQSLLTLINDILDLSKVESGKLTITKEPTDIHRLFSEIGEIFTLKVKNKNLDLFINVQPSIPTSLLLDKTRLRQVLFNIVGNAVKFTNHGEIRISVKTQTSLDNSSNINLSIEVQDTGIGIAESEQENIFMSFQQQEGQSVREYGGTGLGLTISRRLIKLMGGNIFVKSQLNEGSSFYMNIPNVELSSQEANCSNLITNSKHHEICFNNSTILIVDDIKDNRKLLIEIFKNLGLNYVIATNGQEAIDICLKQTIDLVLMDIRMPIMDGYEAAEHIKNTHVELPIIALTASVMRDDYEQKRRENFTGYLRKPVLKHELITELSKYLSHEYKTIEDNENETLLQINNKALSQQCYGLFYEKCINIQKTNAMNDINVFAQSLLSWSNEHDELVLSVFATNLIDACDIFDIQKIKDLLARLVILFEDIQ